MRQQREGGPYADYGLTRWRRIRIAASTSLDDSFSLVWILSEGQNGTSLKPFHCFIVVSINLSFTYFKFKIYLKNITFYHFTPSSPFSYNILPMKLANGPWQNIRSFEAVLCVKCPHERKALVVWFWQAWPAAYGGWMLVVNWRQLNLLSSVPFCAKVAASGWKWHLLVKCMVLCWE